jgi:spore coat polysaccharide biosynthesis protein SpsF
MNQERFWSRGFGNKYITRNNADKIIQSNEQLFERALLTVNVDSAIEFGCNIGLNLRALDVPELKGVDVNKKALREAGKSVNAEFDEGSVLDYRDNRKYDLVLSKGLLIHIFPELLRQAYDTMYIHCKKYMLICEYYNPVPVEIDYRGHKGRLFKRDFAGELIDGYGMELLDYGFVYHRDEYSQDDLNWFLLQKGE